MNSTEHLLFDGKTQYGHYQVVDTIYSGRPARLLYSGNKMAAQSGIAQDQKPRLLFDYIEEMFQFVRTEKVKNLLIIGGGVYTLPIALLAADNTIHIDVVEPDTGLDELAQKYFGLKQDPRLEIFHTDGRTYLAKTNRRYDLVIIDAFSHTEIPRSLMTLESAKAVATVLKPTGKVLMNIISSYLGSGNAVIRQQCAAYKSCFSGVTIHRVNRYDTLWLPLNLLLLADSNTTTEPTYWPALEDLYFETADALHD